jgi:hypothetical protein
VKVSVSLLTGNAIGLYINGVLMSQTSGNSANQIYQFLTDIIPAGKSYKIEPVLGSGTLLNWSELR